MSEGQDLSAAVATVTCNGCGDQVPRRSFQDWLAGATDHFCTGRRIFTLATGNSVYENNIPATHNVGSGPSTPPPTGQQEYVPIASTSEGQNHSEWRPSQHNSPVQSTVIYARTASPHRQAPRRRPNGQQVQRNMPQSTIEDVLKLRSVAYLMMVDLDHLHHRLLRERRDQLEDAARGGEPRM